MSSPDLPTGFVVPEEDLSVQILDALFGGGWEFIIFGTANETADSLVFPILAAFNTVALVGVAGLFIWVMCQGVVGSAHEGKMMGRRFSSKWVPIRGAASVGMLAPVVKGMSIFQVILLMGIGWSVNLGNFVWETGLDTFVRMGGRIVLSAPPHIEEETRRLAKSILLNTTIQSYFRHWEDKETPGLLVYDSVPDDVRKEIILRFVRPKEIDFHPELMGKVVVSCPEGQDSAICVKRLNAIHGLVTDLIPVGDQLADPRQTPDENALLMAINNYNNVMETAIDTEFSSTPELTGELEEFRDQAASSGWATAGAYYWNISMINDKRRNELKAAVDIIDPNTYIIAKSAYAEIDKVLSAYNRFMRTAYTKSDPSTIGAAAQIGDEWDVTTVLRKFFSSIFEEEFFAGLVNNMTRNDPTSAIVNYGHKLIGGVEIAFVGFVALAGMDGYAEGVASSVGFKILDFFTFGHGTAVKKFFSGILKVLTPIILLLLVSLFCFAFTLAFYLPALPMIFWISGVVGWVRFVLEALVAAPLWVAGHAMPEGEGIAGQHGKQGYFLFLAVLIRPALMVTGLLFAVVIMAAVGKVIGLCFTIMGMTLSTRHAFGLVSSIAMMVILCSTILTTANKVYAMISHFPASVTRWIGQQFHNLGEEQDESRISGAFKGMSDTTDKAISQGGGTGAGQLLKERAGRQGKVSGGGEKDLTTL